MGDGQSVILPKLSYMMADAVTSQEAIASISGNTVTFTATGSGKGDRNDEDDGAAQGNQAVIVSGSLHGRRRAAYPDAAGFHRHRACS